jgi:hypothetical protein
MFFVDCVQHVEKIDGSNVCYFDALGVSFFIFYWWMCFLNAVVMILAAGVI